MIVIFHIGIFPLRAILCSHKYSEKCSMMTNPISNEIHYYGNNIYYRQNREKSILCNQNYFVL